MPYFLFPADPYPVIPSVVEESRGNGLVMFWIRFREMFRQAQHDRKQILRDEKQLLHLFSVGATIGRPLSVIKNKTFFLTPRHSNKALCTPHAHCHSGAKCPHTLSFRAFYFTVIPSEAEESRGNECGGLAIISPCKEAVNRLIRRLSACKSAHRSPSITTNVTEFS